MKLVLFAALLSPVLAGIPFRGACTFLQPNSCGDCYSNGVVCKIVRTDNNQDLSFTAERWTQIKDNRYYMACDKNSWVCVENDIQNKDWITIYADSRKKSHYDGRSVRTPCTSPGCGKGVRTVYSFKVTV
ncbi:hypothetical protein BCR41DRAFT_158976 [Lobosporangium transversale]|uniref:Uncharacterized protein n=1 Tax=Lobosporangium transversale TaxID=64571 RepID=A0A1Y2GDJ0_9FUNG|nr:hypothetical protein BCR41DRAFT_158976 [Lobosporangium transversale]ORZ07789.1 hypothetical protein BCR41DRAFT_158976 [Lobosporangium transversale]|eukprot:XP_021878155.1 hypothetical protein BCR41DRAFT_158976 [Lobosporangium transversale]